MNTYNAPISWYLAFYNHYKQNYTWTWLHSASGINVHPSIIQNYTPTNNHKNANAAMPSKYIGAVNIHVHWIQNIDYPITAPQGPNIQKV